jgi:hypothetical protein
MHLPITFLYHEDTIGFNMSSAISFPPNLTFKEFLSHTFPGFFLALSVLMLLDVLSPKDLTSWAFGTLTVFVSAMT